MEEKVYKITLADGTVIDNLTLNEDNLSHVVINDGETDDVHENMMLAGNSIMDKNYLFILRDITPEELADMKLRSDVEYLAMMCDVEL